MPGSALPTADRSAGISSRRSCAAASPRPCSTSRTAGRVYHLRAKPLYRALDQSDNRNRRAVSPALIARKLMVLDYVLTVPPEEWLATEQDKVAWFTTRLGIAVGDLPQRQYGARAGREPATTRYFIHKRPIRIVAEGREVEFVHLVEDETGRHFEQFLTDHLRLLSRVPTWTVVLVAPPHLAHGLEPCEAVFARMFRAPAPTDAGPGRGDLAWFFRVRQAVDRHDFHGLAVADLDRFRDLRRRLSTAAAERVYVEWQRVGDAALVAGVRMAEPANHPPRVIRHPLPWRYHQFGTLPGTA